MIKIKKMVIFTILSVIFANTVVHAAGWVNKGEDTYWQNDDGSYKTGFIILGDLAYYCGADGKMIKSKDPNSWLLVDDGIYKNQFYVDENGIVSMNVNNEPHWVKFTGRWFHYNKNGVIDKDKWIYDKRFNKIYRVDYQGFMCKGWVADPYTHIEYYMDEGVDGGHMIMDNMDSTYQESFDRLMAIINQDEKADNTQVSEPVANE